MPLDLSKDTMAFSRNSEQKNDAFFNHGLNFLKRRFERSTDDATSKRIATEADPFGDVGPTKDKSPRQLRDYSINPATEVPEDEAIAPVGHAKRYDSKDPFAEAYAMLHRYGMVRFGSQREDGSWEVYGPERRAEAPRMLVSQSRNSIIEDEPQAIDPSTQAMLAAELAKFTRNRRS